MTNTVVHLYYPKYTDAVEELWRGFFPQEPGWILKSSTQEPEGQDHSAYN